MLSLQTWNIYHGLNQFFVHERRSTFEGGCMAIPSKRRLKRQLTLHLGMVSLKAICVLVAIVGYPQFVLTICNGEILLVAAVLGILNAH